jgi:DNA-binding NarL/FixJ family response regulator
MEFVSMPAAAGEPGARASDFPIRGTLSGEPGSIPVPPPIRVLVVDKNRVIRLGIRTLLEGERDITVVGEAGDGREALAQIRRLAPDVVLTEVDLPEVDGVTVLIDAGERTRLVVLSGVDDAAVITRAVLAGALGYLVYGQFEPAELAGIVRRAAAGQPYLTTTATAALMDRLRGTALPLPGGGVDGLTAREREVVELVARGLSNSDIADELSVSVKTVKNHLHHIFERLGVTDRKAAARIWHGHFSTVGGYSP